MLANAQRYDLIGMLGRQAVRICAISAVSGDPAHGSSEPARVLVERLVRLITLFDVCSPRIFFAIKIREFFRKWRARQDSNLRPPA